MRTDGRVGGQSVGVRSRDYQIFSDEWDYHISLAMEIRPRSALGRSRSSAMKKIQGKSTLVWVGARFELARARVIESQLQWRSSRHRDILCPVKIFYFFRG